MWCQLSLVMFFTGGITGDLAECKGKNEIISTMINAVILALIITAMILFVSLHCSWSSLTDLTPLNMRQYFQNGVCFSLSTVDIFSTEVHEFTIGKSSDLFAFVIKGAFS